MKDTTIAAIATFPAESALAIIRISGKDSFRIMSSVFTPKNKPFKALKPNHKALGHIADGKEIIDEAMLVLFKSPRSYTGEDMAEISCHGNPYILGKIMDLLSAKGCTTAGPGEFTKRAFLNSKMDLSAAEAVADIISAKNDAALQLALRQLSGGESGLIRNLRQKLLKLLSLVEAEIDFAHEDIQKNAPQQAATVARKIILEIDKMLINADEGIMLKNGIKTAIAGKPNTGKSSLLNALLNKKRAIVTNAPGTTRDTVEGSLSINGLCFKFIDTAGLRQTKNQAERYGISKAENAIKTSDIVIFVIDGSKKTDKADLAVYRRLKTKHLIVALNKSDLKAITSPEKAVKILGLRNDTPVLSISAVTKHGINDLTKALKNIIMTNTAAGSGETLIASLRHKKELSAARVGLLAAVAAFEKGSFEEAAFDLKQASGHLGSITGDISSEDVLDGIFKNFCIGK
jgi:tRNA modification GTPase